MLGYNGTVIPERPDYKSHPLWEEAMALAHQAYGVAETLRARDPEEARLLRKAAVSVPSRVAGALSAPEAPVREAEASQARAALAEVAARAGKIPPGGPSADLARRAVELGLAVALTLLPVPESPPS